MREKKQKEKEKEHAQQRQTRTPTGRRNKVNTFSFIRLFPFFAADCIGAAAGRRRCLIPAALVFRYESDTRASDLEALYMCIYVRLRRAAGCRESQKRKNIADVLIPIFTFLFRSLLCLLACSSIPFGSHYRLHVSCAPRCYGYPTDSRNRRLWRF